jgi:G3E family GTPase
MANTNIDKLIVVGDRVLIEPSGVFDVDEFFDSLYEEPLDRWYQIGSVIAVADALELSALSKGSSYLLASQTANAGAVVLSKTQFSDENKINEKIRQINEALKAVNCSKELGDNVIKKNWSDFTDEDFEKIESCGYELFDYTKNALPSNAYSSLYFMNNDINPLEIREISHKLFSGKEYGSIFRIKGFLKQDENWLELNATEKQFELSPKDNGQDIIIVIGENLNEEKIKEVFKNEA